MSANGKQPSLVLYSVKTIGKNADGKDIRKWSRAGAAWKHPKGKGFNVKLELLPLDGSDLVLLPPKARNDAD